MAEKKSIEECVSIPDDIQAKVSGNELSLKKGDKENKRSFISLLCSLSQKGKNIVVFSKKNTRKEKKVLYSFVAHIKNMLRGLKDPFVYKLKVCSSHFPINTSVSGNKFIVKNFLGEKRPRELEFPRNVEVKVAGDEITVKSVDRELAGKTASNMELLTRIKMKDRRVFQDGIFISEKPIKEIAGA